MIQNDPSQEPLKNVALESAILGLRMALTPEEETQSRSRFLEILRESVLAVPTIAPVPTQPDGSIAPGADIQLVVAENAEGISGIPAFTGLNFLRAVLPQMENGMFLTGMQLSGMLGGGEYTLFIDGPDLHAEVTPGELAQLAITAQMITQMQEQAAGHNERLEAALADLQRADTDDSRTAVISAFLQEFCRIPVAGDQDEDAECIVLSAAQSAEGQPPQELELLTVDGSVPCFTSDAAMRIWDTKERQAVVLPGPVIAQLAAQAEAPAILINPGSESARTLRFENNQILVA